MRKTKEQIAENLKLTDHAIKSFWNEFYTDINELNEEQIRIAIMLIIGGLGDEIIRYSDLIQQAIEIAKKH
jgi:hypothetical protein